jgi:predicted nucleotidyltransferase component of viral defense system
MKQQITDFIDLTDAQKAVLALLEANPVFTEHFYFTGGTLLKALGIVPRESNDLDFFTFPSFDTSRFPQIVGQIKRVISDSIGSVTDTQKGFIHNASGMILEFVHEPTHLLEECIFYGNLGVSHVRDIAAHKASALCCRDEVKDLIDIAFLTQMQSWNLSDLEDLAYEKFGIKTVTQEKLLEEVLAKKDMFTITHTQFLKDGKANVKLCEDRIRYLLDNIEV